VTTKKNAPATPSDQGKKEDTLNKNANKSPATSQEKSQKPLTAGVAKEFIRLKAARPRYVPTNPYFQKAWSDFEARCRDVGVTDRSDINNFERSWFKCLPRGHAFQMPLPGEANQKVVHEQQVFRTKWGYVSFYGPENIGYDVEDLLIVDRTECNIKLSQILDLLGYKRTKQGKHHPDSYTKLQRMLRVLSVSSFAVGLDNEEAGWSNEPIISFHGRKYDYKIKIGPMFDRYFRAGLMTGISIKERIALNRDVSKGLYRFISSHRENSGQHNIISVAQAIGMDTNQPIFKIRQTFKKAIAELKEKTTLLSRQRNKNTIKGDVLIWTRSKPILSGPKLLMKINPNHQIDV